MAITLAQAMKLKYHQEVFEAINLKEHRFARWRVTGMPRTWKTMPHRVEVPIKRGLYEHDYIHEGCLGRFYLKLPKGAKING